MRQRIQRRLFLFRARLGLTTGEARAAGLVAVAFVAGLVAVQIQSAPSSRYDAEFYAASDAAFAAATDRQRSGVTPDSVIAQRVEETRAEIATAEAAAANLNTASADELDTLPGVGPATAAAILDERARRPFASVADVQQRVRGIGPAKAAKMAPFAQF